MARKKVKLRRIENQYARRLSLKKRRESLLKKVHELCILCGVAGCAIISSPGEEQLMHYPETIEGVKEVTRKFFAMSELQRVRKSTTEESYLRNKVSKMQEKMMKIEKRDKENEMQAVIHQILSEGRNIESLSVRETEGVGGLLAERKKAIARKIYLLDNNLLGNNVQAETGPNAAGGDERSNNESDADDEVEGGDNGGGYDLMGEPRGKAQSTMGKNDKGKALWTMDGHDMISGGGDNNNMMISREIMSGTNIENCMGLSQRTNDVVWSGDGNIMGGNNIGDGNDLPFPHYTSIGGENGIWPPQWTVGGSSGSAGHGMGTPQWNVAGSTSAGVNGMGPPQWTIGRSSSSGGGESRIGTPQWSIGGIGHHGMEMPQWTNVGMPRGHGQYTDINGDDNGIGTIQQINGGSAGNDMTRLISGGGGNDMRFSHYTTVGGSSSGGIGIPPSQDTNGGDNGIGMILQWINDGAENSNGGNYNMEVPTVDGNSGDTANNTGMDRGSIANEIHGNGNNVGQSNETPNSAKD